MAAIKTRKDDDQILEWMHLRCMGESTTDIGAMFGAPSSTIRTKTNNVKAADIQHSGELACDGRYW